MADDQISIRIHGLAVTGASRSVAQPDPSGFLLPSQPREGHGAHGQGSPRDPLMPSGEAVRPPSNMVPTEGGGAKEDAWERRPGGQSHMPSGHTPSPRVTPRSSSTQGWLGDVVVRVSRGSCLTSEKAVLFLYLPGRRGGRREDAAPVLRSGSLPSSVPGSPSPAPGLLGVGLPPPERVSRAGTPLASLQGLVELMVVVGGVKAEPFSWNVLVLVVRVCV